MTDNFSAHSPGRTLVGQGTWTYARESLSLWGVWVDNSTGTNHAINYNSSAVGAVQSTEQFSANQFAEITFAVVNFQGYVSLLLRASGIGNENVDYLNGLLIQFNNNEFFVSAYIDNDEVSFQRHPFNRTFNNGDTFRAEIEGTTIRVYHNDVLVTSVGTNGEIDVSSYISNHPVLASGNVGFGFSYGDGSRISQFYGGDLVEDEPEPSLIEGETSGVASVVGTLRGIRNGVGAAAGVSTVSGTLTGVVHATALSEGISSVTGSVIGLVGITGAIDGESTVTGSLSSPMMIEGGSDGQASVEAVLIGQGSLVITSEGISEVSATITGTTTLAAGASGQAIVIGNLRADTDVGGTSRGEASVTGILAAVGDLTAVTSGSTDIRGNLSEWLPDSIQGRANGIATVTAEISAHGALLAASDGIALVGGTLGVEGDLSGEIIGQSAGRSVVSGWLSIVGGYPELIKGMSRITTMITGMSRITEDISGVSKITEEIQGVSKIL